MKRASASRKPDEIMTVSSLADYLHCHTTTVYRLLRQGKIPGFRIGSDWRFERAEIDKWIAKGGGSATGLKNRR